MKKILLIEDDEMIRHLLRIRLVNLGYTVIEAANGAEGLALHAAEPMDLVLTDLIMPEKEGLETIMELRRRDPAARIIAMSGGGRLTAAGCLSMAQRLGANSVLAKPFSNEELTAAITALLETDGR